MHARPAALKRFRLMAGLTQVELAAKAKLAPAYVNRIERGREKGGMKALHRLATVLNVSIEAIADFGDNEQEATNSWQQEQVG